MKSCVVLVALLSFAGGEDLVDADIRAADTFVDDVLDEMRYDSGMKEKLDPMALAKFGEGSYEITNGKVFNLLGFMRSGNSSILYSGDGETVVISTPIKVSELFFFGRHMYSKAFVTIRGDIEAKIEKIDASSILRMPLRGGASSKLESLMILEMQGLEITKITGLSRAFNWLLKIIANRAAKQFKEKIESAFEKEITPSFEKFLNGRASPPMNGSAELTEMPFEGELQSDSPSFGMGYGAYMG